MNRWVRRVATLASVTVAVTTFGACGDRDERVDEVRGYLRATSRATRGFSYESAVPEDPFAGRPARKVTVQGLVEDDFRFKVKVSENGADAFEEVVSDDTLAVRFLDPRYVTPLLNKRTAADVSFDTDVEGLTVVDALGTRRWVVDPSGAPPLARGAQDVDTIGRDPVVDALTALAYVDRALTEAVNVEKWSEDDLTPPYNESEDTFPAPEKGSGVTRYDLVRPDLPAPGSRSTTGEVSVPSTRHFRRMAVYVKDGRVIRVMEHVDIRGRRLDRFRTYFKSLLRTSEAPADVVAEVDSFFENTPEAELPSQLLQFLNVGLRQFGTDPILVRTMTLDFPSRVATAKVDLPSGQVVKGDLGVLVLSGKSEAGAEGEAGSGAESGDEGDSPSQPAPSAPSG